MARMGAEAPSTPLLSALLVLPRPTPRFFGAFALALVLEYYGATSEVPWLFLLASWVAALIVAACIYSVWNRLGLSARVGVVGTEPGPQSPVEDLPEQLLRGGPIPEPIFEGDRLEIEIGLETSGAPRGPAHLTGIIGAKRVSTATGLVPRSGWKTRERVGPLTRGPVGARSWFLEASDPLGLFRCRRVRPDAEVALVLPRFTSLVARAEVRELEASIAAPRAGSGTEMFGVREYRPGDPLRRIHWRSSARHGELVVREYEPPGVQTLGIFCDPAPATKEVADQIARLAASEAWDCIRDGGRVVLWAPGQEASRPSESRSLWSLLEWLARYPSPLGAEVGNRWGPRAAGAGGSAGRGRGTRQPALVEAREPAPTHVSDAVAITSAASSGISEALETVRRRGGRIRAWVVGDVELAVDAPVRRVGTAWPL
jgi:uncharacterized protein (DUF58 family)